MLLEVYPEGGSSIVRFARKDGAEGWIELMRPALAGALENRNPLLMSCFPLVPYCDLVTGGAFDFREIRYALPLNHPAIPHPIHGEGWISPWQVARRTADEAVLQFAHDSGNGFPFAYKSELRFQLFDDRLVATIKLVNEDSRPMPAGIGIHPYFIRDPDTRVRVRAMKVWPADAVKKGLASQPVPPEWDFSSFRDFGEVDLDHSFADWDCRYDIVWPSLSTALSVTADPIFRNLLIFVPRGGDHFCIEPISNAMDAFNLAALGFEGHNVSVLQPGHQLVGTVTFVAHSLSSPHYATSHIERGRA